MAPDDVGLLKAIRALAEYRSRAEEAPMKSIRAVPGRRYRDFVRVIERRTVRGAQNRGPYRLEARHYWQCQLCNEWVPASSQHHDPRERMDMHAAIGHTPCAWCGRSLKNRKDGTPRQHAHHLCLGKSEAHRIVRAYQQDISTANQIA